MARLARDCLAGPDSAVLRTLCQKSSRHCRKYFTAVRDVHRLGAGTKVKPEAAAYVSEMIRRIAPILLMGPALDASYAAAKANAVEWKDGMPVKPLHSP